MRPSLITIGGSLNLVPHPVARIREIADEVGAKLLFDAAHLMTMSTYKSLGAPPGGLIVTNDAELAQRLDAIAYPGLTANAAALAEELATRGVPVFRAGGLATPSHQFAVVAERYGGGQRAVRGLREAHLLACGIGLPLAPVAGDTNGLRLGTPFTAA